MTPAHLENELDTAWRSLHIFNIYRLILSGLFTVIFFSQPGTDFIGKSNPDVFGVVAITYTGIAFISGFASRLRVPAFTYQAFSAIFFDIILLTLLMNSSGGSKSGLGILIIVSIAGSGLLMGGRLAFTLAAVATLSILSEQIYNVLFLQCL